jgi:hypothetical protein
MKAMTIVPKLIHFDRPAKPLVVKQQRVPVDQSHEAEYWRRIESRVRFVAWLLVLVTTVADVVITFGPHIGLTWRFF